MRMQVPNPWAMWQLSLSLGLLYLISHFIQMGFRFEWWMLEKGTVFGIYVMIVACSLDRRLRPDGSGRWMTVQRIPGPDESPYLARVHLLPLNPHLNIYLHIFSGSDDDRGVHDHPWHSLSLCLWGRMREWRSDFREIDPEVRCSRNWFRDLGPGSIRYRRPTHCHRLELRSDVAVTLFVTGPKVRSWGFWINGKWRHHNYRSTPAKGSMS